MGNSECCAADRQSKDVANAPLDKETEDAPETVIIPNHMPAVCSHSASGKAEPNEQSEPAPAATDLTTGEPVETPGQDLPGPTPPLERGDAKTTVRSRAETEAPPLEKGTHIGATQASVLESTDSKVSVDTKTRQMVEAELRKSVTVAEETLGKVAITSRYHRLPRRLEDDYVTDEQVLGSGYNGSVFLASNKTTNSKCAVKGFKLHGLPFSKRKDLENECSIFLSLDHPHVARLMDVYESEDHLDLVMECMEGGELFQRVVKRKRFSEKDAAQASYQMLLSIAYIHSHGIVHRDIKMENFLYETKDSEQLKLIDFGFSKVYVPDTKMRLSCGTLPYLAPEVLKRSYTSQCDIWSLGVVVFVLLVGYMPFSGSEKHQIESIKGGHIEYRKHRWATVSAEASEFVGQMMQVDPKKRLTADQALEHPWIKNRESFTESEAHVDQAMADALIEFSHGSHFKRACMSVMAWSLTADERAEVRQAFLEMDKEHHGTISIQVFKQVMQRKFHIEDEQAQAAFAAIDQSHTGEIHYSDFLAAMVSSRIKVHENLLKQAFRRFDTDGTGYITRNNFKEILGGTEAGDEVDRLLQDMHPMTDGKISYNEFITYLKSGDAEDHHQEAAHRMIDNELKLPHEHVVLHKKRSPKMLKMRTTELIAKLGSRHSDEKDGKTKCCDIM